MSQRFQHRARPQLWLQIAASSIVLCLTSYAHPQAAAGPGGIVAPVNNGMDNVMEGYHQGASLQVTVLGENKIKLDRQAVVRMHCDNPLGTTYQTTKGGSQTTFLGLSIGKYSIEVSAAGYLSAYKEVEVSGVTDDLHVTVAIQKDAAAINLDATGTSDALMSSKASKDT